MKKRKFDKEKGKSKIGEKKGRRIWRPKGVQ
jgi:hypothetical protein